MTQEQLDAIVARCQGFEQTLSRTIATSDVGRINAAQGAPVEVASETVELIERALDYCKASGGLFDITIGAVSELWDFHEGVVPSEAQIEAALPHVGYELVRVDGTTVTLADPDARLDLGGIAKGYVSDVLLDELAVAGVTSAYVNLGGNVKVLGAKPDGSPWRIGVRDPNAPEDERSIARVTLTDGKNKGRENRRGGDPRRDGEGHGRSARGGRATKPLQGGRGARPGGGGERRGSGGGGGEGAPRGRRGRGGGGGPVESGQSAIERGARGTSDPERAPGKSDRGADTGASARRRRTPSRSSGGGGRALTLRTGGMPRDEGRTETTAVFGRITRSPGRAALERIGRGGGTSEVGGREERPERDKRSAPEGGYTTALRGGGPLRGRGSLATKGGQTRALEGRASRGRTSGRRQDQGPLTPRAGRSSRAPRPRRRSARA